MSTSDREGQEQKRAFDWEGVRGRIAAVSVALDEMQGTDPEMVERIWSQRAAQLAKPPAREEAGRQVELALIQLGREVYGIEVQYILEIRPAVRITRVPRVPEWVTGVVNLRGRILSVLDLRRFFGLAPAETREEDRVTPFLDLVVVETPAMEVALLVEDVLEIEPLATGQMQSVAETIRGVSSEYVRGVIERGTGTPMIVVLDLPALLADERLIIQEEAT
jgi:purine-binding chemotaxis protein CheW